MKKGISKEIEIVVLVADLSGYTALTEAHGNLSAAETVNRYMEIVEAAVQVGSRLVERVGDEVLIVGTDAAGVLQTAISLRDKVEEEPLFPSVHAGIHAGSVLERDGHYFGTALNLTARVAAHARGGQILCTDQVTKLAGDLDDIEYRALGLTRFKNITHPVAIFEVVAGRQRVDTNVVDPVCRMQVRYDTAPARLPYGGNTYYFCSFDCAKTFADRPDRYVGS